MGSYPSSSGDVAFVVADTLTNLGVVAWHSAWSTDNSTHAGSHLTQLQKGVPLPSIAQYQFVFSSTPSPAKAMPRKAAQKVTKANPLEGCAIATSGRFQGTTQSALQSRVTSLGATIASTVNSDTNYLVTTEKDFESNSTKVKAATTHGVPIVTLEWLEECESSSE